MSANPTDQAILVTGGAGYIGAHIVDALAQAGRRVVVVDDLSTGSADRLPGEVPLVRGDVGDPSLIAAALADHQVGSVIHIAAKKQVGESVERPLWYYRQNVTGFVNLLECCVDAGVERVLFSSSAATYGMPDTDIITEDTPARPINPYGESKLIGEWLMADVARSSGLRYAALRYFNVAGAARPELGDPGVFNLIPLVFAALTRGEAPKVFGDDWPTPDGTCIRDYVHIADLADAHICALDSLERVDGLVLNVGTGTGTSVRQVIDAIGDVLGRPVEAEVVARRPGDPAALVASVDRIADTLGWSAGRDLTDMVASAWQGWVAQHPEAAALAVG
ncbi:MAG: UDP-glucose 4-epimerase GalE [Microthrixaceae bacterium]